LSTDGVQDKSIAMADGQNIYTTYF